MTIFDWIMRKIRFSILFYCALSLLLSSCLTNENKEDKTVESVRTQVIEKESSALKAERIKKIFYSLPSPLELTLLFKKEGITYQSDKLHKINRRGNYSLTVKKALNLGVYGADLSYAGLFGKHQDAIQYFTATQLIAGDLGIAQVFQSEFISRLEENANNKDTLLQVISEFFLENDGYLKNHEQQDISTYVLTGGWIEGMYLGINMIGEEANSEGIREVIAGQKYSLHNLIVLLQNVESTNSQVQLIDKIGELEGLFNEIPSNINSSASKEDGVLKIKGELPTTIPDSTLAKIETLVAEIRLKIID